jgi:hypothetical protein
MRLLTILHTLLLCLLLVHDKAQETPDSIGTATEVKFGMQFHDLYGGFENMEDASVQPWMSWKNKQTKQILAGS